MNIFLCADFISIVGDFSDSFNASNRVWFFGFFLIFLDMPEKKGKKKKSFLSNESKHGCIYITAYMSVHKK